MGKLQKIHNLLMGKKATEVRDKQEVWNALNEISNEEDGIERDDFKCYLQIGADKYISEIKKGLRPKGESSNDNKRDNLLATLKWFVEGDKEAAEILYELSVGDDILEALLLTLADLKEKEKDCIDGNEYSSNRNQKPSPDTNTNIWWLEGNEPSVRVGYAKDSEDDYGEIKLASENDKKLYNALSCFYGGIMNDKTIFSYSATEPDGGNEHIFNLAFDLLKGICDAVTNKSAGQDKACASALMCWTAWQDECTNEDRGHSCPTNNYPQESTDLWNSLSDHSSDLIKNYKRCKAFDFADYF